MEDIMSNKVIIHCQPSILDYVNDIGYDWDYSQQFGTDEVDVLVDNVTYEVRDGIYQDPDEQLCEHYGIDYDYVNCIEAV